MPCGRMVSFAILAALCIAGCVRQPPDPMHLFETAMRGDEGQVRRLIRRGVDVNARFGKSASTALHVAARRNATGICRALLDAGADPNAKTTRGETPLQMAVLTESCDVIRILADEGADLGMAGFCGMTALHLAAARGKLASVQALIAAGADVNAVRVGGGTPLSMVDPHRPAPDGGDPPRQIIEALRKAGGYDSSLYSGLSAVQALCYAAGRGDVAALGQMLEKGMEPNAVLGVLGGDWHLNQLASRWQGFRGDGTVPLHWACVADRHKAAELLITHGADVDAVDGNGCTPLSYAASNAGADLVQMLLEKGADANRGDPSPVLCAMRRKEGGAQVLKSLLAHGADPNRPDASGDRPLHAVAVGDATDAVEMARLLLDAGADANANGWNEETPLEQCHPTETGRALADLLCQRGARLTLRAAIQQGKTREALDLVAKGVDLYVRPESESMMYTMVDWALAHGQKEVARALQRRGVRMSMGYAICAGHPEEVDRRLRDGESPNEYIDEESYLMCAVAGGHAEVVRLLLEHGAKVNVEDIDGCTALDLALQSGDGAMARLLRRYGGRRGSGRGW